MARGYKGFSADIVKFGINPAVDPPDDVVRYLLKQAGRSTGPIPVRGFINGAEFIQTLIKYQGAWRLYVNGPMLKSAALRVGDSARIYIAFDPKPRDVPMPDMFRVVLSSNKHAKEAIDGLPPFRRKEILRYLGSLKNEVSLSRNVEKVMKQLTGDKTDKM